MSNDPVFMRAGELLLEHLRSELVPVVISSGDMLKIAHPGMEEDFRLGLYLHDLEEVRPNGPPGMPIERWPSTAWVLKMNCCCWRQYIVRYTARASWSWTAGN